MRVFVFSILLAVLVLPLLGYKLLPDKWIEDKLTEIVGSTNGMLQVELRDVRKKFPYRLQIGQTRIFFKKREVLEIHGLSSSFNPYFFLSKPYVFRARGFMADGTLNAELYYKDQRFRVYLDSDILDLSEIALKTRLKTLKGGFLRLRLWLERKENTVDGIAKIELTALKMTDVKIDNRRFPSSLIDSIWAVVTPIGNELLIEQLKIEGEGFDAIFRGWLRRRIIDGVLEIYAYTNDAVDLLGDFKKYQVKKGVFLVPVKTDVISVLETPVTIESDR